MPRPALPSFLAAAAALVGCFLLPPAARAVVAGGPGEVRPLLIGAEVPGVEVATAEGPRNLRELVGSRPTVLVFYRGSWCPYCSRHLQDLMGVEAELLELGYQILAVSPDAPPAGARLREEKELGYTMVADSRLAAAEAFGLAFRLPAETLERYRGYGIDLGQASGGGNRDVLPVPAVFITDAEGRIAFTYVDPDYRYRVSGDLVLAAARAAKSFRAEAAR